VALNGSDPGGSRRKEQGHHHEIGANAFLLDALTQEIVDNRSFMTAIQRTCSRSAKRSASAVMWSGPSRTSRGSTEAACSNHQVGQLGAAYTAGP